jgi:osmotically-inducible protein OsmY
MPQRIRFFRILVCLVLFTVLLGCAGSRTRESTGQYVDDSAITTKVKTSLLADKEVSGRQVEVETFKGVVQLSGFVDTPVQRQKAEQIARRTEGVKEVKNNLIVK